MSGIPTAFKDALGNPQNKVLLGLVALIVAWRRRNLGKSDFFFKDTPENRELHEKLRANASYYVPPLLMRERNIQTIYSGVQDLMVARLKPSEFETETLQVAGTPKGPLAGLVSLTWMRNKDPQKPWVVLIPGLSGGFDSFYIQRMSRELLDKGYNAVCFNPRGSNGLQLVTSQGATGAYTGDLRQTLAHIRKSIPANVPLFGIGWSLGSSYIAKYHGEDGENSLLDATVSLAPPMNFEKGVEGMPWWWHRILTDGIKMQLFGDPDSARILAKDPRLNIPHILQSKKLPDIDQRLLCPAFGYSSCYDYYRDAGCGRFLSSIKKPALFIVAKDDNITAGWAQMHEEDFLGNPNIFGIHTDYGAHGMTWDKGMLIPNGDSWVNRVVLDYFGVLATRMQNGQKATPDTNPTRKVSGDWFPQTHAKL